MQASSATLLQGVSVHRVIPASVQPLTREADIQVAQLIGRFGLPRRGLSEKVNDWRSDNAKHLQRGFKALKVAQKHHILHFFGALYLSFIPAAERQEPELFFGLASLRVVTTVGAGYIVDAFQNSTELENMKYHAIGTGTGAEAAGDTALGTEWTSSEYATRVTGTTTEGANASVYRTIGTNTKANAGNSAVTEHGVFSSATIGAGVLLDRSVFAAITLNLSDSLQSQYDGTFSSGN